MITKKVMQLDPWAIKLLDLNARFMRHEVFQRLVENVKRDGDLLGNTPFCWTLYDDDTKQPKTDDNGEVIIEVLSGNHRVKAAREAKLKTITVEVTDDYLSPDQRAAIQLSHNALTGEDDPTLLKTIYSNITDVTYKIYSGMDDVALKLLDNVSIASLGAANLDFQTISMTFLPDEAEQINAIWDEVKESASGSKALWLNRMADYDKTLDSIEAANMSAGVKNTATALFIIFDIFDRHMDELKTLYLDEDELPIQNARLVPLQSIFGYDGVRADLASKLNKTIQRMVGQGKAKTATEALTIITDYYIESGE